MRKDAGIVVVKLLSKYFHMRPMDVLYIYDVSDVNYQRLDVIQEGEGLTSYMDRQMEKTLTSQEFYNLMSHASKPPSTSHFETLQDGLHKAIRLDNSQSVKHATVIQLINETADLAASAKQLDSELLLFALDNYADHTTRLSKMIQSSTLHQEPQTIKNNMKTFMSVLDRLDILAGAVDTSTPEALLTMSELFDYTTEGLSEHISSGKYINK